MQQGQKKRKNKEMVEHLAMSTPASMFASLVALNEQILMYHKNALPYRQLSPAKRKLWEGTVEVCREVIKSTNSNTLFDVHEANLKDKMRQIWGKYDYIPSYTEREIITLLREVYDYRDSKWAKLSEDRDYPGDWPGLYD